MGEVGAGEEARIHSPRQWYWGGAVFLCGQGRGRYLGSLQWDKLWIGQGYMGPRFGLPTVKQTLRALFPGHFQCDLDMGEQFLNYPLHMDLREYSGVGVSEVRSSNPANATREADRGPGPWERWERNWMGLRDSLYCSLQWQVHLVP